MENYCKKVEIRWSDLDPNYHLRHSVYYDWGAYCRLSFLNEVGLSPQVLMKLKMGPVIFREEAIFKKEILFTDTVEIYLELAKCKKDFSRWSMQHSIIKNKNTLAAVITIDGAWLNIIERKLTIPPPEFGKGFNEIPKTPNFTWDE